MKLLSLLACLGNLITVDDDGPADFASIRDAVGAATDGDVVLVEPGSYGSFALVKLVSVIGHASGSVEVTDGIFVSSESGFVLAGLDARFIVVERVAGRGLIDDCTAGITQAQWPTGPALDVRDSADLIVTRSTFGGPPFLLPNDGSMGARVMDSQVVFVDCTIRGDRGFSDPACGANGGDALKLTDSSVLLAGCEEVLGGASGVAGGFTCCTGAPGNGLDAANSLVVARGSSADSIATFFADRCGSAADAVSAFGGILLHSGLTIGTGGIQSDAAFEPVPAQPYLEIVGEDGPGDVRRIDVYGPAGASFVLAGSLAPATAYLPGFEGQLAFDPTQLVFKLGGVAAGQDTPVSFELILPEVSGWAGTTLYAQAAFPGAPSWFDPSKSLLTNPATLILRY